jgi:prepilin-type N-terminal cleavage/methylation domain-containing protein
MRAGLTLIELLVVVAIMAIMVAVLLPILGTARSDAQLSVCREHLHTMHTAIMRTADKGGRLPQIRPLDVPIQTDVPGHPLPTVIMREVGRSADAFQCPGDRNYLFPLTRISYYFNPAMSEQHPRALKGTPYDRLPPASVPLLWDADNHVFDSAIGPIEVPRFHDVRQSLFNDGSVSVVTDSQIAIP